MEGLTGSPQGVMQTDPRTAFMRAQEMRQQQMGNRLTQQYQQSLRDPAFALGDPQLQQMQMNELIDKQANALGERGVTGPAAKAMMAKAVADWKLGQMQMQQQARDQLRQGALQAYGHPGTGATTTPIAGRPGVIQQVAGGMTKDIAGQVGGNQGPSFGDIWKGIFGGGQQEQTTNVPSNQGSTGGMDVQYGP
jgi:hypothetical protein